MATFSSFSASAILNFAATESFTNGPIICFNGTVTATSSLSASNGGNYVVWGASNSRLTGYNYLTLVNQTISESNLSTFIELSKTLTGVDFGADCEDVINTYVSGQNLYDLFEDHNIILSQSFLYPTIVVSRVTMSFGNVYSNTSTIQTFNVQGFNLLNNLTINLTNTASFSLSTNSVNFITSSLTLSPVNGVINPTTIYTQFAPNSVLGGFSGSIQFNSTVASASIFVTGSGIQEPVISIDFGGYDGDYGTVLLNTSSSQQQFIVSGLYLTSSITVSAGDGFLVSLVSGSGYTGSCVLTQSAGVDPALAGVITDVPVYSVFYPTASGVSSYLGSIGASSTYATPVTTLVQGIALEPSIYFEPALLNFGLLENGSTSSQREFLISGSGILTHIEVDGSSIIHASLTSGSGYSNTPLILTQSAYVVDPTTIYVVLIPTTSPGGPFYTDYKMNSTGSIEQFLYLSGSVIGVDDPAMGVAPADPLPGGDSPIGDR
jgi:hypothetical protein